MSILSTVSLSTGHLDFTRLIGSPVGLGEYYILQALADSAGASAVPATAGALPTPPALVAVTPAVGDVGLITLPTFTDGDEPLASPTVGPLYHGPRALTLAAPESNAGIVYWSQFDTVRPVGGTSAIPVVQYVDEPDFDAVGDWTSDPEWSIAAGSATLTLTTFGGGPTQFALDQNLVAPAGGYQVTINVSDIEVTGDDDPLGTLYLDVRISGTSIGTISSVGVHAFTYTDEVGNPSLSLVAVAEGDIDNGTIVLASVEIENVPGATITAADVGTPLKAGETILLTGRDIDLTRPLYVVPVAGEASEVVIANYLY